MNLTKYFICSHKTRKTSPRKHLLHISPSIPYKFAWIPLFWGSPNFCLLPCKKETILPPIRPELCEPIFLGGFVAICSICKINFLKVTCHIWSNVLYFQKWHFRWGIGCIIDLSNYNLVKQRTDSYWTYTHNYITIKSKDTYSELWNSRKSVRISYYFKTFHFSLHKQHLLNCCTL